APGQSSVIQATFRADRPGTYSNIASVTGPDGTRAENSAATVVAAPGLGVRLTSPAAALVGEPIHYVITVANSRNGPLTNVIVRDQLPPEVSFVSASAGGQLAGGQVLWNLGTLAPGEEKRLQVAGRAEQVVPKTSNIVTLTAAPGVQETSEAPLEIRGV